MILVVGGTGCLGRLLVARLVDRGERVRVLSRSWAQLPDGCELAVGDLTDSAATAEAVAGCDAVISAAHGFLGGRGVGPAEVDGVGNEVLITAAQRAGVRRFVLLSIRGAVESHRLELFRAKAAAERTLRPTSLDWTIIRPTAYLETWLTVIGEKLPHGPALVFGRGKNPINMVSVEDVADVVVACLEDPAASRQSIEVTGPVNVTMVDLARALGAGKVRYIPRAGLRTLSLLTRPISPAFARQSATALFLDTEDMTAPPFVAARTTVSDVLASWRSVGAR